MPPDHASLPPWRILGLDASWEHYSATHNPTHAALLRRSYRRALLQHHPDKRRAPASSSASSSASAPQSSVTVDQIKAAYTALGGRPSGHSASSSAVVSLSAPLFAADAHTGLETVDLDELAFDADAQMWFRGCRCGNARGFVFGEADLEEELDAEALALLVEGEENDIDGKDGKQRPLPPPAGELLVECQDCSLWLCVHFAVAADESDGDGDGDDGDDGDDGRGEE